MVWPVRQEIAGNFTTASSTTVANTFASACLSGSTIEAWVTSGTNGTQPSGVADSASQTYTSKAQSTGTSDPQCLTLYIFQNNASATALTVTATWSSSEPNRGIWLREITDVGTAPFLAGVAVVDASPGLGADIIRTTQVQGTAPFFCSGIAHANSAIDTATGTGFTIGAQGWQQNGSGNALAITEGRIFASSGAIVASFGNNVAGGAGNFLVGAALYTLLCPNITAQPTSQYAKIGSAQSVTFSVTATASGGSLSYQWYKNGSSVGGATSSTYSPTVNYPQDAGNSWYCIVTDSNGSIQTNSVTPIFQIPLRFTKRPTQLLGRRAQDFKSELTVKRWF